MEHLIDKYLKKPEAVKDLFTKEVSISLKVDGAAFQISYDKENDSITYHKRGGSSKSLGPVIDEYTQLMRKNINDAINYFESKKEAVKKYKFYAIEMFNDSYILLTVIDNEDNIIDDRNKLIEISKSLGIDCVPILFEGKLNSEQVESLLSMMTLEPETSNDVYKQYLTNIFGKGDYQKFLVGDEVEGIVLTWNIDNVITQYKIINPAFKTRHDKEIKQGNEDYKKEIEEYINIYELIYETINKIGKHEDDNWIKNLDTNFINMINNENFKSKFDNIIKTLQPKFKDFFTLQINKASKEIQDLIKEHGDNMKFLYEKYLQVFFKAKKRNYFISKEFQLNVNKVIERLQSKNESLKLYITRMKNIKQYINESEVISINEKLSFGDTIYKFGCKIMGLECITQDKYIKELKSFVQEHSNNKCSIIIKTYKQIKSDLDNCLNKNENVPIVGGGHMTIKEAIDKGKWFNDITLNDNTPFVCYYSKDNKNKYVLEQDSLFFIAAKTKKGYREIKGGLWLKADNPDAFGWLVKNVKIPQTLDYEQWEANEKKKAEEKKKQEQESIKASIKRMEDELAQLKELVKNEE